MRTATTTPTTGIIHTHLATPLPVENNAPPQRLQARAKFTITHDNMAMTISNDKVVSMHYTLKNNQGEVIDSSLGGEPLDYLHGHGNIIPGLENALTGKTVGDVLDVAVKPEDGYGVRDEDLLQTVERSIFGNVPELQLGMQFQARSQEGTMMVRIIEIDGNDITVDGNHPLAGEPLNFHVEIIKIRDATAEELAQGHAPLR